MSSFLLFVSAALLSTFIFSASAQIPSCSTICPKNEVFSSKANTCQETCWSNLDASSIGCSDENGCVCKKGYVRHPDTHNCIPRSSCPRKQYSNSCPKNEVYSDSAAGCQKSCATRRIQVKCRPVAGCMCKDGYIRNDITGLCIQVEKCDYCPKSYESTGDEEDKKCTLVDCIDCERKPNECFNECGSLCAPTCRTYNMTDVACPEICIRGCFCKEGYVRDEITKKCVKKDKCTVCPENEVAGEGNPFCETCETTGEKCHTAILRAVYKCYCREGWARETEKSKCIEMKNCSRKG